VGLSTGHSIKRETAEDTLFLNDKMITNQTRPNCGSENLILFFHTNIEGSFYSEYVLIVLQ
jgi:hypothetical protein